MNDSERTEETESPKSHPASADGAHAPTAAAPTGEVRPGMALEAKLAFAAILAFVIFVLVLPHPPSDEAPMGELEDAAGQPVEMETEMAPVTLVHFWSTWCPPCITETPAIERLAADLAAEQGFRLLMVAVQDDAEKVEEFLGSADDTLYDPNWEIAHSYGTKKLPETHLVVQGKLVESFVGAISWDDPEVRQKITSALDSARRSG